MYLREQSFLNADRTGDTMNPTLLIIAVVCIAAAIIGGGMRAMGVDVPVISSVSRQILLGIFGILVLVGNYVFLRPVEGAMRHPDPPHASPTITPSVQPSPWVGPSPSVSPSFGPVGPTVNPTPS